MTTKRKHNKVTLKKMYEALKEFDKDRPNKEVAIQFNVPRSTLSTLNQPILLNRSCWIDQPILLNRLFLNFLNNLQRVGWWKWRWRIRWTNCASLKKWIWRDNQNFEQIKSVHRDFRIWSFYLKANPHNQIDK